MAMLYEEGELEITDIYVRYQVLFVKKIIYLDDIGGVELEEPAPAFQAFLKTFSVVFLICVLIGFCSSIPVSGAEASVDTLLKFAFAGAIIAIIGGAVAVLSRVTRLKLYSKGANAIIANWVIQDVRIANEALRVLEKQLGPSRR